MDRIFGLSNVQFSQITFLLYLIILVPAMLIGFFFARRKMFRPHHKYIMTFVVLANWFLILFHMALSYTSLVLPSDAGGPLGSPVGAPHNLIPTIHLITGGIAQILGTYLVILMWTEKTRFAEVLPKALQIRNIKPVMRTTLALWLVTAALGLVIFLVWYPPSGAPAVVEPVATEEATQQATLEPTLESTAEPIVTEAATPIATDEPASTPESS